jgi:hypothetical protein
MPAWPFTECRLVDLNNITREIPQATLPFDNLSQGSEHLINGFLI